MTARCRSRLPATGVEGLKAIVPIAGVSSYYDHRRSYGTVINSNPTIGTDADTLFDNILTRRQSRGLRVHARTHRDRARTAPRATTTPGGRSATTPRYVGNFKAAVLISHGLNDLNTKPRMYARL